MISVKGGTQTWSNSQQHSDYKSDGAQNVSASDRGKALGGEENVGDVLNKVADPNYQVKKPRAVGNPELGKDAFMSLLLTQMKNQDPTNPLKSHEMAAQLAQFTSLEKLNNINEGIGNLRKDAQPNLNFQALSYIGKTISTDNAKISRTDKDMHHELKFDLPADAQKVTMQVKNAEGKVVRTQEMRALKSGRNQAQWNGQDDSGVNLPPGEYMASYEAEGSNGHKLHIETKLEGTITGVNFTGAGPQLLVGKQVVSMSEVKSISDPSLEAAPAAVSKAPAMPSPSAMMPLPKGASPTQSPKKAEVKAETRANAAQVAKLDKNNLADASMTQGLINKLNKDGAKAGMN